MTRRLAVCADDFGGMSAHSEAIATLAERGRLVAIACLTNGPHWQNAASLLGPLGAQVERGLHFNLTEGRPLSPDLAKRWPRFPGLRQLIARAHLGALPRAALDAEFRAQIEAFAAATGAAPRVVDGQQHVHHQPVIRTVVLDALARCPVRMAVRNTGLVCGPGFALKRMLIEETGGRALARQLRERGIAHNAALTGVYDFAATDYRALMRRWLAEVPDEGALLFCHPGSSVAGGAADPIAAARAREAAYLGSAEFESDLRAADITLAPVWRVAAWS
jgi:predicted glycoside hydrolase/deacetylase ChbG (UPF0249 family)